MRSLGLKPRSESLGIVHRLFRPTGYGPGMKRQAPQSHPVQNPDSSLDPALLALVRAMAAADVERDIRDRLHFVWVCDRASVRGPLSICFN